MPFDNTLRKAAFTGIASNTNAAIMVTQIEAKFIRRREADISTSVAVDQGIANCLEGAVRSFTTMRSRCRSLHADVTFRCPLLVFRVARCSWIRCFQTRIIVALFRGTRAPIA
ncbi:uncharacterized protein TNCV_748381 [Trichonephila clavipes]|nr:uncharacterized protein TNCV_748381 [Trichonephila clavipes]